MYKIQKSFQKVFKPTLITNIFFLFPYNILPCIFIYIFIEVNENWNILVFSSKNTNLVYF